MPNISFVLFYIYADPKHAQNTQDPGTGISRQKLRNLLYVRDVTGCDWGGRGRLPRGRHDKEASPASHRVRWALGPTSPLPQRRRVPSADTPTRRARTGLRLTHKREVGVGWRSRRAGPDRTDGFALAVVPSFMLRAPSRLRSVNPSGSTAPRPLVRSLKDEVPALPSQKFLRWASINEAVLVDVRLSVRITALSLT